MGFSFPRAEVNRLSVAADVRIDFGMSSIRAYPRTNAISYASFFEIPATPRACCLRVASSPLNVAAASVSASRHTRSEAGGFAGEAPGGITGWPASPSPGGCNLLLRDPATYVWAFFLSLLCALLPSLSSSYPLSRGSTLPIVYVDTINRHSHFCVKARTSCFPF